MATNKDPREGWMPVRSTRVIGFDPMGFGDPADAIPQNTPMGHRGQAALWTMHDPLSMGSAITGVASGNMPGIDGIGSQDEAHGPWSKIGGAVSGAAGKVGDFMEGIWGDMKGVEKAWLLSQVIGTGADLWSAHKQGKLEDEERKRRERAARAAQPYIREYLGG